MHKNISKKTIDSVINQENTIKTLLTSKPSIRKLIVSKGDKNFYRAICVIILNILQGKIKLTEKETLLLQKYKNYLRKIIEPSTVKRKRILIQKGGFLSTLLPILLNGISIFTAIKNEKF